jgi:hypothetical protein
MTFISPLLYGNVLHDGPRDNRVPTTVATALQSWKTAEIQEKPSGSPRAILQQ